MVLVAACVLIAVPPLLGVWPWATSIYRGMALLVAASPCALALGTPAAILSGIAQAARHGVLVKGGAQLEALGMVRALAVDKTGTLTIGRPDVTDVVSLDGTAADDARGGRLRWSGSHSIRSPKRSCAAPMPRASPHSTPGRSRA